MSATGDELRRAIGDEIRYFRQKRKWNRDDLAERTGISVSTIGRIEREGPVDVAHTARIADALAIRMSHLVRRAEESLLDEQVADAGAGEESEGDYRPRLTTEEFIRVLQAVPVESWQQISPALAGDTDGILDDPNARRGDFELAAHDEDHDIEDEQGHDEHP